MNATILNSPFMLSMRQDIVLESFFKIILPFEWIVIFYYVLYLILCTKYPRDIIISLKTLFETEYNIIALIFPKPLVYYNN